MKACELGFLIENQSAFHPSVPTRSRIPNLGVEEVRVLRTVVAWCSELPRKSIKIIMCILALATLSANIRVLLSLPRASRAEALSLERRQAAGVSVDDDTPGSSFLPSPTATGFFYWL